MANKYGEIFGLKYGSNLTAAPSDAIPMLTSVGVPSWETEAVNTSNLGAGAKTFRASKKYDCGTVPFAFRYDPSETIQDGIFTAFKAGTTLNFAIDDGSAAMFTFNGIIVALSGGEADPESPEDLIIEGEIKVTGDVTIA